MSIRVRDMDEAQKRRRETAAIRGGAQRNEAAVAWNLQEKARKATAQDNLARTIMHYFRLFYPGQQHVPPTDLVFWKALSDVTGEREGDLTKRAAELGIWPWSPFQVVAAVRDRGEGDERQAA